MNIFTKIRHLLLQVRSTEYNNKITHVKCKSILSIIGWVDTFFMYMSKIYSYSLEVHQDAAV
jgi:hypothetical protein